MRALLRHELKLDHGPKPAAAMIGLMATLVALVAVPAFQLTAFAIREGKVCTAGGSNPLPEIAVSLTAPGATAQGQPVRDRGGSHDGSG